MKKFKIAFHFDNYDRGDNIDAHVESYEDPVIRKAIVNGNKRVTRKHKIEILFDYPLDEPAVLSFKKRGGFTVKDIFRAIYRGYKKIYREEDRAYKLMEDDLEMSGTPYGLWGHYLDQLVIEGVTQKKPGYFVMDIGS